MVDVFGGSGSQINRRRAQGPMGPRGLSGSIRDFCQWLPKTTIVNLQKYDEIGGFFIENTSKDLEVSGREVKKWISRRVDGYHLVAKKASSDLVKIGYSGRYALGFKKNRYESREISVMDPFPGSSSFLCITFKMMGEGEQVLLSNFVGDEDDYCEIRLTNTEIILHLHGDDEIIQHPCKDWTTLFVECNSDGTTAYFKYDVNGQTGLFTRPCTEMDASGIALGSRYDDTYFFNGGVLALEFYQIDQPSEVPEELKRIVIKNQRI